METRIIQCAVCGAELDMLTMRCPHCSPSEEPLSPAPETPPAASEPSTAFAPPPAPRPEGESSPALMSSVVLHAPEAPPTAAAESTEGVPPAVPPTPVGSPTAPESKIPADEAERILGLALFEAEEALARGHAERALVVASKAVKEHPESLTARALFDRARREMLRGRRRERMEARLQEARALVAGGSLAAAERIVTSALKILPDHAVALELFALVKQRRLSSGTAEAEAERELLALDQRQARQAAEAARTALEAGRDRQALLALRHGLRLVPDDTELLALLRKAQSSLEKVEEERSRRRALVAQVRDGIELFRGGRFEESQKTLQAVLREDPENERALVGMERIRAALQVGQEPPSSPNPPPPAEQATPPAAERVAIPPQSRRLSRALPRPPGRSPTARRAGRGAAAIAPEIMLPRTRRRGTPWRWIAVAACVLAVGFVVLVVRLREPARGRGPGTASPVLEAPPSTTPSPLLAVEPELRLVIEKTLTAYAAALEKSDAELLATARPDMTPAQRETRLTSFHGALNATTDIRIVDIVVRGDEAIVSILSTDVIVGGPGEPGGSMTETLVLTRRGGIWSLTPSGGPAESPQ